MLNNYSLETTVLILVIGFIYGSVCDYILPEYNIDKKILIKIIELLFHILLLYCGLVFIPEYVNFSNKNISTINRLHDKMVLIIVLIGTSLTLLKKIDHLRSMLIDFIITSIFNNRQLPTGATNINSL